MSINVRETLSAKQERAIVALIASKTLEEAAGRVGVTQRTLYRWQHEDVLFQTEYRHARRAALDSAIAGLQAGAAEAVTTLRNALDDRSVNVRVRAALGLLEHALTAHQVLDLSERLKALEEASGETVTW